MIGFYKKIGMRTIVLNEKILAVTLLEPTEMKVIRSLSNSWLIAFDMCRRNVVAKPQLIEQNLSNDSDKAYRNVRLVYIEPSMPHLQAMEKDIKVKVTGTGKGKGFQGCVVKHGFSQQPRTRGGRARRRPGSAGARKVRIFKGKRMPGHMGGETITIKSRMIVDNGNIFVIGSVPGANGTLLRIISS